MNLLLSVNNFPPLYEGLFPLNESERQSDITGRQNILMDFNGFATQCRSAT